MEEAKNSGGYNKNQDVEEDGRDKITRRTKKRSQKIKLK